MHGGLPAAHSAQVLRPPGRIAPHFTFGMASSAAFGFDEGGMAFGFHEGMGALAFDSFGMATSAAFGFDEEGMAFGFDFHGGMGAREHWPSTSTDVQQWE